MEKTNGEGFTLVELIVVIAILAILGTLGFISFFGYQLDARNTKRDSDIKSIHTQMEILYVQGMDFAKMLSETGATLYGGQISLGGFTGSLNIPGSYQAGDIDYAAIKILEEDFLDPKFQLPYKMGYSTHLGTYQIAATIELSGGEYDIISSGNYSPRKGGPNDKVRVERSSIKGNVFYTKESDPKGSGFLVGDQVGISTGSYVITSIKSNKITLNSAITSPGNFLFLKNNESRYLIKKWDSNFPIDTDKGYQYTPYYSN